MFKKATLLVASGIFSKAHFVLKLIILLLGLSPLSPFWFGSLF
jgi:hypothetical protein